MYYDEFINQVNRGEKGDNKGLPTGLQKLGGSFDHVQRATYYLIGGEPGTGKTALADECFVINPILSILNKESNLNIKIFYKSFEVDKVRKIAKWTANLIYKDYNIITSLSELLSKGDNKIPSNVKKLLPEYKKKIEDNILNHVILSDNRENPTGIYKEVKAYMEGNGEWREVEVEIIENNKKFIDKRRLYFPNDPNEIVLLIIDHIGLLRKEKGYTKKQNIDKLSEYGINLRNDYGVSPVYVSQFNRSLADINRQRFKEPQPQLDDFKDTGNCSEDANVVIANFNPMRYGLTKYMNYDISKLNIRFRGGFCLKNRDGMDMTAIGLNFLGENGYFRELPNIERMTDYNYKMAENFGNFIL